MTSVAGYGRRDGGGGHRCTGVAFITTLGQVFLALVTGAPLAADTTSVITSDPTIAGAIGSNPSLLGLGSLGGSYAAGIDGGILPASPAAVDLGGRQALNRPNCSSATSTSPDCMAETPLAGAGVTGVSLDINANGVDVSKAFADAASAANYFNDSAVDLGSLSGAKPAS